MKRTLTIVAILAAAVLCPATATGVAASPVTPDRVAVPSGHVAAPNDLSYLTELQAPRSSVVKTAYPPFYDLRTLGRVSPVKDQGAHGTCWAFASLGSLESGLLASDPTVWDFSEDNLAWFAGFSVGNNPYDDGGNSFMALAYLARWGGPVNETDDPYLDGSHPAGLAPQRHLSEAVFVAPRTFATDTVAGNDAIKEAVMTYGAVDVDMWWPTTGLSSYTNQTTDSFDVYTYGTHTANHDVLVVGWDDAYAATNFATTPPGPGAFIVRNSWGSNWGRTVDPDGYFYVSYYDTTFAYGGYNMAFADAGPTDTYVRAYQYDPLGFWPADGPYVSGRTSWFANVFKAAATEDLAAAGFYTPLAGCSYEVYTSASSGTPRFADLTLRGAGAIATPGYHVVTLDTPAPLISGHPFTIAVKLTVPLAYHYPIPVESPHPGYSRAKSDPGQSYVCRDGATWRDLTTLSGFGEANVCLKGFTTGLPGGTFKVNGGEANVCLKGFTTGLPGGTFKVNGGKAYSRSVSVRLRADVCGAAEMRFRDQGGAWTEWAPFATRTAWTLPSGDGAKTIEAEFRNARGTTTRSATISLDTVSPVTRAPYKRSVRRGDYVRLPYKVTDTPPCATRARVTIKIRAVDGTTTKTLAVGLRKVGSLQSYRFRCWLAKRTYRFFVYATDAAGNTQRVLGQNYLYVR